MLSSEELAAMRQTQNSALPDVADILRPAVAVDAVGEPVETLTTVATGVACRISPNRQGKQAIVGERIVDVAPYVVTFPYGTDVRAGDRIVSGGATYEVLGVRVAGNWATAVQCDAARV